jgi:hypothetical protein
LIHANLVDQWYNRINKEETMEEEKEWGSIEYPITLGYTKPNGEKVSIKIHNAEESEDAYHTMFWFCGPDVPFSVD